MPNPYSNSVTAFLRQRRPEYEQAVQDRLSLPSWRAAIPKTGDITGAFVKEEAGKALEAKKAGIERKEREGNLGLKTRRVGLAEKEAAFRNQSRWDDLGIRQREAAFRNARAMSEINQAAADRRAAQGQGQAANWLSVGGLGLEGLRGYRAVKDATKTADFYKTGILKAKEGMSKQEQDFADSLIAQAGTDPYKLNATLSILLAGR